MRSTLRTLAAVLFAASAIAQQPVIIRVTPSALTWESAPPPFPSGSAIARVEGSPSAPAPFTMRLRLPAGSTLSRSAWPTSPLRFTVLSGRVMLEASKDSGPMEFPAGSFFGVTFLAGDLRAELESVLQVYGQGPWRAIPESGRSIEQSVPETSEDAEIRIVSATPFSSAVVGPSTVARLAVRWSVPDFRPGRYRVVAEFESTRPGVAHGLPIPSKSGDPARTGLVESAEGETTFEIPLGVALEAPEVRKPLRFWLVLQRRNGPNENKQVARTRAVEYVIER